MEFGSPVSAFEIPGVFLTNRQAHGFLALAKAVEHGLIDLMPPADCSPCDEEELQAIPYAIQSIAASLIADGWTV